MAGAGKPFFFRAPPRAAELLARSGVDCVTLANNHVLDFGSEALLDTIEHLSAAGIRCAGAGPDVSAARTPALLEHGSFRLAVVAAADHPADFAATGESPGVAFADLRSGAVPEWLLATVAAARAQADAVLFSPHWGPNLTAKPPAHVRAAAAAIAPHVTLVAGHSAHVFHGVGGNVIYDLGDFVNDYESVRPARSLLAGIKDKLRKEIGGLGSEVRGAVRHGGANRNEAGIPTTLWRLQQRRARRIASMIRARTMRPDLGLAVLRHDRPHGLAAPGGAPAQDCPLPHQPRGGHGGGFRAPPVSPGLCGPWDAGDGARRALRHRVALAVHVGAKHTSLTRGLPRNVVHGLDRHLD